MSVISLQIPAKPEYLLLTRLALSGLARVRPIDAELLADLKLAITEGCANAVRHAYDVEGGSVRVRFELTDGRLEATIEDDGRGFVARDVPDWQPEALDEDGMGLAIIRAVVDDVRIEAGEGGRGTRLWFAKQLD